MKTWFAVTCLLLTLALLPCAGQAFKGWPFADARDGQSKQRTFTVGFDPSFPPFGFKDAKTGELKGFDLELAEEVCKRNGWKLVKRPIDWAAKDSELNAGIIDCIWNGFSLTKDRVRMYTWTQPYVANLQVVVVRRGNGIETLTDLNGRTVVAQDGSCGAYIFKKFVEDQNRKDPTFAIKELKLVPDYVQAGKMLETGAVDALTADYPVAKALMASSRRRLEVLKKPLKMELFSIAFKKGNTAMRNQVQKTLKDMVRDGTVEKILRHWRENEKENGGDSILFVLKP